MIETEFSIILTKIFESFCAIWKTGQLFWIEFGDPKFWGCFILDEFYACSFNEFLAIFYVVCEAPGNIMFFMQMFSSHLNLDELFRRNAPPIDTTEDPEGPPVKVESNVPPRVCALVKVRYKSFILV